MRNNKVRKNMIYMLVNLALIIMISIVYVKASKAASMFDINKVYLYVVLIGLLLFLFGVLTEYEKILEAFKNGFRINKVLFILAIVILIISCLPPGFAIPINFRVGLFLSHRIVRYIFSIWSGILVARALVSKVPDMKQSIVHIALVVKDYDEAIDFYTNKLKFELIEDTYQPEQDKRWVVVAPPGSVGTTILLARASKEEQEPFIGNQSGGRVFLFLNTDDFWRDYHDMIAKGIEFIREPKEQNYGLVAVFKDLYGNQWDLLQLNDNHVISNRIG